MIAYALLLLRRYPRRPGGQLALVMATVFPATGAILWRLSFDPRKLAPDGESIFAALALVDGSLAVANLIAASIQDERDRSRSRLLRTGNLDGVRAVVSYLAVANVLAASFTLLALLLPAIVLLGVVPAAAWLPCLAVALYVAASGALGIWVGYLVPRTLRPVCATLAAWGPLGVLPYSQILVIPAGRGMLLWVGTHALCLFVLAPIWRRTSSVLW
ncbi:MAG: hypothetical protein U0166_15125 [Acidobacteriota bacterium]